MNKQSFITYFLIAIFIFTSFVLSLQKVYEPDCFWQLKTGELILKTHSIPSTDPFALVTEGVKWVNTEWLFQVFFYLLHQIGGFNLIEIVSSLFFVSGFFLLLSLMLRKNINPYLALALAFTGVFISYARVQPRPQVISYFLMPLMLFIINEYRLYSRKYIYFLPILFLIWVNFHAGAVIGLGIFASFVVMEAIKIYISRMLPSDYSYLIPEDIQKKEKLTIMVIIILLCFIAVSFLSPNTIHIYDFLFRHQDVVAKIDIHEFQRLDVKKYPVGYYLVIMTLLISFLGFRRNFQELPAVLLMCVMVFRMHRFLPEYAMIAFPAAGLTIQSYITHLVKTIERKKIGRPSLYMTVNVISFLAVVYYFIYAPAYAYSRDYYDYFGFGRGWKYFPENAMEFIEKNNLSPNMYNSANFGGALIYNFYPRQKVFQDTRLISYEQFIRFTNRGVSKPTFQMLLDYYDVNYLILDRDLNNLTKTPDSFQRDKWALVYFDDTAEILVRKIPENERIYKGKEYLFINPETIETVANQIAEDNILAISVIVELRRALKDAPDSFIIHYALGTMLAVNISDPVSQHEAELELRESLRIMSDYPMANKNLAELLFSQGRYGEAVKYYEKFVTTELLMKSNLIPDRLNELGTLYVRTGMFSKARKAFKKALKFEPDFPAAKENLNNLKNKR
ncbi:MAG TPA: tetratricopeptide repeat protein [bacterium]